MVKISIMKNDHIIITIDKGHQRFICKNCGYIQNFDFPMEVDVFAAFSRAFIKSHSKCKLMKKVENEKEGDI